MTHAGRPLSAVYADAADRVRAGWCQHRSQNASGGVCANGAILKAAGFDPYENVPHGIIGGLVLPLAEHIRAPMGGVEATAAWNDAPGRRQAEVVEALEAVAAKLKGQGR